MKISNEIIKQELEAIENALLQLRDGATIDDIRSASGLEIELRTLQRRLAALEEKGIITSTGKTKKKLYFHSQIRKQVEVHEVKSDLLPLSKKSREIQAVVSQPIQKRKPVGYNRDFLVQYRPNRDSYLTKKELDNLAKIGTTNNPDQPAGTYAKEILNRLLIDLSWNSSRLEGNTYSLLDTQRLISFGESANDKSATEAQMILNHKDAIEFLVQSDENIGFNRYTILNLHALLSNNLLPDPAASGRLRTHGVGIHQSVYEPLAVPQQIEEFFELILDKASQIEDPFEQAFFVMVQLPYLQPFDDVNKRVSRLAANISFNRHNLAPLSFIDVPGDLYIQGMIGVYELGRIDLLKDVFLWAYERSAARYAAVRQSLGEPDPFRLKYREQMRSLIAHIVSGGLSPKEAIVEIKEDTQQIPINDQSQFMEAVETELLALHEGNFARYRITPAEFKKWSAIWQAK
ncbi:MAG: Fic family protein [Flavipsychrobacter sp.]|nr:Fic family protein [Flavipsychrobacter sp.]